MQLSSPLKWLSIAADTTNIIVTVVIITVTSIATTTTTLTTIRNSYFYYQSFNQHKKSLLLSPTITTTSTAAATTAAVYSAITLTISTITTRITDGIATPVVEKSGHSSASGPVKDVKLLVEITAVTFPIPISQ